MALPGYQILDRLHEGARHTISRARRLSDDRRVVIKSMVDGRENKSDSDRLEREFEFGRLCVGPRVVTYLELNRDAGVPALIIEDCTSSLDRLLVGGPVPLAQFFSISIQLAEALATVHRADVNHRDVKPANVMLRGETGEIKLADFGSAAICDLNRSQRGQADHLEGTIAYMAPEQTGRMGRVVDYRSDLYGLGVTLYELLTGRLPFNGDDLALIHAHLAQPPPSPTQFNKEIPAVLSQLVLRLLAKDPDERYQSAEAVRADLDRCQDSFQHGRIESFTLAAQSLGHALIIPTDRRSWLPLEAALQESWSSATDGGIELFGLVGPPGVGKSTLLDDFARKVVGSSGTYLSGACDSTRRDIPYSPLIGVLSEQLGRILCDQDDVVRRWSDRLSLALGANSGLLEEMIPEIRFICGPGPTVPDVPAGDAKHRFQQVLLRLVQTVLCADGATVLAIEDIQWCDLATLDFLPVWLLHPDTKNLLVIWTGGEGAERKTTGLAQLLGQLKFSRIGLHRHAVPSLDPAAIARMLAQSFQLDESAVSELAAVIHAKTGGTALFVHRFLRSLHQHDALLFDPATSSWTWDLQQVERQDVSDNMVQYLATSHVRLGEPTERTLQAASVIGVEFDLTTLIALSELDPAPCIESVLQAVSAGLLSFRRGSAQTLSQQLIAPADDDGQLDQHRLGFTHESLRRSFLELTTAEDKTAIQLRLGQYLRQRLDEEKGEAVFEVVRHLNRVRHALSEAQRHDLARLNLVAGNHARRRAANEQALQTLQTGLTLLGDDPFVLDRSLAVDLHRAAAEAALTSGTIETVAELDRSLQQHAVSIVDRLGICETLLAGLAVKGDHRQALRYGLKALGQLGIRMKMKPSKVATLQRLLKVRWHLSRKTIDELRQAPDMTDPVQLLTMRILNAMIGSAYFAAQEMVPNLLFEMVTRCVTHGYCPQTIRTFAAYGFVCSAYLNQKENGLAYCRLAQALQQDKSDNRAKGQLAVFYGQLVGHWADPFYKCAEVLREGYDAAMEAGDLEYAGFCLQGTINSSFSAGRNLAQLEGEAKEIRAILRAQNNQTARRLIETHIIAIGLLRYGRTVEEMLAEQGLSESELIERWEAENRETWLQTWWLLRGIANYTNGNVEEARTNLDRSRTLEHSIAGHSGIVICQFYQTLALLEMAARNGGRTGGQRDRTIRLNRRLLQRAAQDCAHNYLAKSLIVEARYAGLLGRHLEAMDLFEQAIQAADRTHLVHESALANELAGRLHTERSEEVLAGARFKQAIDLYDRWGATAKARALKEEVSQFLHLETPAVRHATTDSTYTHRGTSDSLDFRSAMKSAVAIAHEMDLERLLKQVLSILAESAGAERGCLLLREQDDWMVRAHLNGKSVTAVSAIPFDDFAGVASSVIRYVARTDQDVVIDDARRSDLVERDPYITRHNVKALLCARLRHQSRTTGLIVLENNLVYGAFSDRRIEVLKLLFAQAAVALENANLYQSTNRLNESLQREIEVRTEAEKELDRHRLHLEELVRQRTAALESAKDRLVDASRRAGMAEVATGVLHNVGNVLNSVNVVTTLIWDAAKRSKLESFYRTVELLERERENLAEFITRDERGKKIPTYLAVLADKLKNEQKTVLNDISRLRTHIDHIKEIVSAQQAFSRTVCAVETFDLKDVVADAIEINLADLKRNGVRIEQEFEQLPQISSDKHKVLQILINLLSNTKYALADVDASSRTVTVRIKPAGPNKGRVEVEDTGRGISQENLTRIFNYGFTTREDGNGFGLHTSANTAGEIGGRLTAHSDGPGRGARFVLELPFEGGPLADEMMGGGTGIPGVQ